MTYGTFETIIALQIAHHKRIQALYQLKVNVIDAFDEQEKAIGLLWQEVLTVEGFDWLSWFLYEKDGISGKPRKDLQAWDQDKNEICKSLKGLYDYLVKEKYFRFQLADSK